MGVAKDISDICRWVVSGRRRWINLKSKGVAATEEGGSGDFEKSAEKPIPTFQKKESSIPLLRLPEKVRKKIWSFLNNADCLKLRSLSREMRNEIDTQVGLSVIMDTSTDSMYLIQVVAARNCRVRRLQNLNYFNFFTSPEKLERLYFEDSVPLSPEPLEYILRKFPGLQLLSFVTTSPSTAKSLLNIVHGIKNLFGFTLEYDPPTGIISWTMEMSEKTRHRYINVNLPSGQEYLQEEILEFMTKQTNLAQVRCDIVGLKWGRIIQVLKRNEESLIGVQLLNLLCSKGEPFNCGIFSKCLNLRMLTLSGENSFTNCDGLSKQLPYLSLMGTTQTLLSLPKLCMASFERIQLRKDEFMTLKDATAENRTLWIRFVQSLIVDVGVVNASLGVRSNGPETGNEDDDEEDFTANARRSIQFIQFLLESGIYIPGLIVTTAWIVITIFNRMRFEIGN